MTDYSKPLDALPEPYQRVYEAIYEAAYLGLPCPSNKDLALRSGYPGAGARYATQAVTALERAGLIAVIRGLTTRIVALPSGQATKGSIGAPNAYKSSTSPPVPLGPRYTRSACTYCGVRSDIGCRHQPVEPFPMAENG